MKILKTIELICEVGTGLFSYALGVKNKRNVRLRFKGVYTSIAAA
jgi:hypothetical protein